MHFSYWMVLVAALLPYAAVGGAKSGKSYDNANPRGYLAKLTGWRGRAASAHQNHFEAFPAFAAAVIIAQLKATPQHRIDLLAGAFIFCRIAYTFAYVANLASLRSMLWFVGLACVIALIATG